MTQRTSPDEVAREFDAEDREAEPFVPRFNVAPTDPVIVVLEREDGRVVERHRWGLIPHWADAPNAGARMINARSETLMTSSAFRVPFRKRRCVVASDGFYEWRRRDGARDAFFMHRAEGTAARTRSCPWPAFGRCGATRRRASGSRHVP